ncbi:MAG: hypothetical protein SGILL_008904 [Bacillariaceae sp.]
MRSHSADDCHNAAEQRDDAGKTALHFACQNSPPKDVIEVFLVVAIEVLQWPDSFGWLPVMYSCAYGADTAVIQSLADAYPESKTTVDRKGRTPLHFALGMSNSNSHDVVVLLSSTGAASYADDHGMLPLHYACAYGASEEALYVLTDAYLEAITTTDRRGRTPLHFALSNAGRKAAPAAVRLLLSLNRELVNSMSGGPLPLRVLSEYAATIKNDEEQRESVNNCLKYLLAAKPDPTADFFTALQSLPEFLQERPAKVQFPYLIWLYVGATYFLLREIIQVVSLISLKALHIWVYEPSNWLNVIYIVLIYVWAGFMTAGGGNANAFRYGTAWSFGFIWLKFLAYLRNISIDFAVFTGGVFHGKICLQALSSGILKSNLFKVTHTTFV